MIFRIAISSNSSVPSSVLACGPHQKRTKITSRVNRKQVLPLKYLLNISNHHHSLISVAILIFPLWTTSQKKKKKTQKNTRVRKNMNKLITSPPPPPETLSNHHSPVPSVFNSFPNSHPNCLHYSRDGSMMVAGTVTASSPPQCVCKQYQIV